MEHNPEKSIWFYLPPEIYYSIFDKLPSRYLVLLTSTAKDFLQIVRDYFLNKTGWVGRNMNFLFFGAHMCGKTATIGHILKQNGLIPDQKSPKGIAFQQKLAKIRSPEPLPYLSCYMNRKYSIGKIHTQNYATYRLQNKFHTFTLIDTPGCGRAFMSAFEMLSQANSVVFIIDGAYSQYFVAGYFSAVVSALGHSNIVIALNQNFKFQSQQDFDEERKRLAKMLFRPDNAESISRVKVVPINVISGWNIYSNKEGVDGTNSWYKGPTLYRAMHSIWENLEYDNDILLNDKFFMPVGLVVRNRVPLVTGIINSGCFDSNMPLKVCSPRVPDNIIFRASSVERYKEKITAAETWENIGMLLEVDLGAVKSNKRTEEKFKLDRTMLKRGVIIADARNTPKRVESFVALLTFNEYGVDEGSIRFAIYRGAYLEIRLKKFIHVEGVYPPQLLGLRRKTSQADSVILVECEPQPSFPMYMYPIDPTLPRAKPNQRSYEERIFFLGQMRVAAYGRIDSVQFQLKN